MYSCCLRAIARQASSQQQQMAEVQAGATAAAAVSSRKAFSSQPRHYRHYHSSPPATAASAAISPSQASTSSAPTGFPMRSARSTNTTTAAKHYEPSPEQVTSHLNTLFEGLQPSISPELAVRMVTHKGAISPNSTTSLQHNTKLSLIGKSQHLLTSRFHLDI